MTKRAIILHGTLGSPEGNWFRWLESELQERGLAVWLPALPSADKPSLRRWVAFIEDNCPFAIDVETLVIGHSSGAILSLILAQESPATIGSVVAVSVFHDNSLNWDPNAELFDVPFDFAAIRQHVSKMLFVHSDSDPYIPLDQAMFVAEQCHGEMVVIPDQGHFNTEKSDAYQRFPKLVELLEARKML